MREHQNTNVVKFYGLLDKCYPLEQIVYYQVRLTFTSVSIELSITPTTRLTCLVAWHRNLLQPRSSQSISNMAREDCRRGHRVVRRSHLLLPPNSQTDLCPPDRRPGISTSMSGQDTSSSCKTIGLGTRSVSLVRRLTFPRFPRESLPNRLPPMQTADASQQDSLAALIPHVPWQDYSTK